jgi:hypothetical protein
LFEISALVRREDILFGGYSLTRCEPRVQTARAHASLLLRETPPARIPSLLPCPKFVKYGARFVGRQFTARALTDLCGRGAVSSQATSKGAPEETRD